MISGLSFLQCIKIIFSFNSHAFMPQKTKINTVCLLHNGIHHNFIKAYVNVCFIFMSTTYILFTYLYILFTYLLTYFGLFARFVIIICV